MWASCLRAGRRGKALRLCTLRPMHIGRILDVELPVPSRRNGMGAGGRHLGGYALSGSPEGRRIQDSSQNRGGAGGKIGRFLKANSSSLQNHKN